MMTLDRFTCSDCGADTPAGASPHAWNAFVAAHIYCDSAPQNPDANRDRLSKHDEEIGKSGQVWFLRLILAITTGWFMVGMHLTGAHIWQSALVGCVVFVAALFFFEHDPAKGADQ